MRTRRVAVVVAVLSLLGMDGAERADAARQQPVLPDTNAIPAGMPEAGRRVFHGTGTCFACHGPALEGGPVAPTLRTHAWRDAPGGTLPAIYSVITHGVPGTLMVSHPGGIDDADAVRVAVYVWSVGRGRIAP